MHKLKVLNLRDLAIKYYPKAYRMRANFLKYNGDSGLMHAAIFEDQDATAIEKAACELLRLTFMHPEALLNDPHVWDAVKDAETIATKAHTLEMAVEMQSQIETLMLDAARLLCELTGVALPPWVDADYAPAAKDAPTQKRQRQDALAVELDEILVSMTSRTPAKVMAKLRMQISKPNTCILNNVGDGIEWENDHGDVKTLTIIKLGERIREWKKTGLSQG